MSPSSTRAFAARLADDDAFRARVAQDPSAALAEYGVAGRRYVEQFEKARVFENFLRELAAVP